MRRILQVGYDFLKQWERGPRNNPNVRLTPDGAALDAYKCSAGKWTIGFGCTEYEDGSSVKKGDSITPDRVQPLLEYNIRRFEAYVDKHLAKGVSPFVFTANVLLAYNIGCGNWLSSTVRRESNEGNEYDAASAYSMFTGSTTYAPTESQLNDPDFADFIGEDDDGNKVWVDPDSQPCGFMFRLRGLLARHHAEGCISLGLDWRQACADHRIFLVTKPPAAAYYNKKLRRWIERIDTQTEFEDVHAISVNHPISDPIPPKTPEEVTLGDVPKKVESPEAVEPEKEVETVSEMKPTSKTYKLETVETGTFSDIKSMLLARRFWGWLLIIFGRTSVGASLAEHAPGVGQFVSFVVGDSVMFDTTTGVLMMVTGEALKWWGERKATKALK